MVYLLRLGAVEGKTNALGMLSSYWRSTILNKLLDDKIATDQAKGYNENRTCKAIQRSAPDITTQSLPARCLSNGGVIPALACILYSSLE